ncbi:MAG TPA: hypothetical protein VFQ91_17980 [Bryobacteraceae bacterium]|nr:hypothetical protein [Bryobacteraceae bacterium]
MAMNVKVCFVFCAVVCAWGQIGVSGSAGTKAFLTVPMVGSGTWDDPKRPALVKESGVPFRFQISDDGRTAIVEVSPRTIAEMSRLEQLAEKEANVKIFRPEKDKGSDVVSAFKQLKKDFSADAFGPAGPPVKTAPAAEQSK